MKFEAYVKKADENGYGEPSVKLEVNENDGVSSVYLTGLARVPLDKNHGAGIKIMTEDIEKWMSCCRYNEVWCKPIFGKNLSDVPDETQGLVYLKKDGKYGVMLPVVSERYRCVLMGSEDGITAKMYSGYEKLTFVKGLAFVFAEGENPFRLLEKCTKEAVRLLNNGCRIRSERRYPEVFEYLGWCSWDAFQIRVTDRDLVNKCEEFKKKNIPIKWAIIDDMWGEVRDFYGQVAEPTSKMVKLMHTSKLYSFEADPIRFPDGLKSCIDNIKAYGIKVGIWHPTTGYWRGLDPDGSVCRDLADCLTETDDGMIIHDYKQERAYMYYSRFHDYLRECGADFVKIDNQSICDRYYKGKAPIGVTSREYHNAMEASVGQHFDNTLINCMGMSSEDMWNRSVSPISRCSNDFVPEDRAWFGGQAMQCAYNSMVQGQLYYCDWDMWWTDDDQAVKNSVLRAVSGGPVYVSDTMDRSRAEVLKPLAFDDGRILRCDRPAMPSLDCIMDNPKTSGGIFKIQNVCGNSGVIAAFNINEENCEVSGSIAPSDIDGIEGEAFAVYEHFSRKLNILGKDEKLELCLKDADDFRLYIVVPITDGFAPIGRIDKFISPKSVKCVVGRNIELVEKGEYAYVEDGKLVFAK